jgi:hypothetical protein
MAKNSSAKNLGLEVYIELACAAIRNCLVLIQQLYMHAAATFVCSQACLLLLT